MDFVAVLEHHARRAPVARDDPADGRVRADLDSELARRCRDRIRNCAGAPFGESPRSERAVDFAHVVVEQHVGGARRSHTLKRADDARGRHRRLQHVGLEPLIEKIGRAHRHELHEPIARFRRHRLEAPAQAKQLAQIERRQRERIGCADVERRLDEARHVDHRLAVFVVGLGVDPRVPQNLAPRSAVVVDAPQVVAVWHRRERAVERQHFEAVAGQIEIADDLRAQQRHDVGADGDVEAGKHLFGHGRAAQHVPPLEHEHATPRARQIRRVRQPVVAAADHDHVVLVHCRF